MAKKDLVRLLICGHCNSVQEIPWCGTDKNCGHHACLDPLNFRIAEHQFADGRPHAPATLADIEKKLWNDPQVRKNFLSDIPSITGWPGTGTGLGDTMYDIKANFDADAMTCWKAHNRTTDCAEYHSDSKRLVPDTKAERRDLGLESRSKHMPTSTFLCDFCPMKSILQTKVGSAKHGFNNPYK